MVSSNEAAVVNSATWAAFGDALGFISELADVKHLRRRAKTERLEATVPWRRRVGGKFGVEVELPAGAYSDDTQLRLATSRAVGADGRFDTEAFAKIELPVWSAYALGAGRGSRAAAAHLGRSDVTWFSNFFEAKAASYVNGGGNGVAIRVQPHVWAAPDHQLAEGTLTDLVRNAVTSHGHMRAVAGAFLHASCLSYALTEGTVPEPDVWLRFCKDIPRILGAIDRDKHLSAIWLPAWEERSGTSLNHALARVAEECIAEVQAILAVPVRPLTEAYDRITTALGATDPEKRGSGTTTAILGSALAWLARDAGPRDAISVAANALGTDTDSIATMAGAILGATCGSGPTGDIQDRPYIEREARRLFLVSRGQPTESFGYPDLLSWIPPRTQSDAVGMINGSFALAGIGRAEPRGKVFEGRPSEGVLWQWFQLDFGQTVVAKRRPTPKRLPQSQWPVAARLGKPGAAPRTSVAEASRPLAGSALGGPLEQVQLFEAVDAHTVKRIGQRPANLDELTGEAIRSGFEPAVLGRHLLLLMERDNGMELAVAYAATVAKARIARLRQHRGA